MPQVPLDFKRVETLKAREHFFRRLWFQNISNVIRSGLLSGAAGASEYDDEEVRPSILELIIFESSNAPKLSGSSNLPKIMAYLKRKLRRSLRMTRHAFIKVLWEIGFSIALIRPHVISPLSTCRKESRSRLWGPDTFQYLAHKLTCILSGRGPTRGRQLRLSPQLSGDVLGELPYL